MGTEIYELTAAEMLAGYRAGSFSRREVVAAHLARIDEVNGAVNGVIYRFDERALKEAEVADSRGTNRGDRPLDGVPVLVSDWYAMEGVPQAFGVRALADNLSPADDVVVRRLREAGAIILGKTAVPEYLIRWNAVSELFGETLNARDVSCSAGGSGGGAATSVAAGMAPIAFHSDLGGSLRVPASYCGVIALRPSGGVVPLTWAGEPSQVWESWTSLGPFARSLEDAWLALRVVAGPHASMPKTVPLSLPAAIPHSDDRPRVARIVDATGVTVSPEIRAAVDSTAAALERAGYEVVDAAPPGIARLADLWAQLLGTEVLHSMLPPVRNIVGASAQQNMDSLFGPFDLGGDLKSFIAAEQELHALAREVSEFMADYPLILSPATGMTRPPIGYDDYLSDEESLRLFDRMRSTVWVNTLELPAVALGNGAQIVGRRFHDPEPAAAAARAFESLGTITVAQPTAAAQS